MTEWTKARPKTMLVFGASGRIGGPLARFVRFQAPDVALRLATSSPSKATDLQRELPGVEVVTADYLDQESLTAALAGIEAVFLVTPDFLDEERAMENLVAAVRAAGTATHIVRVLGDLPNMTLDRISQALHDFNAGTAVQHFAARRVLDASGLPVTYINSAAYYMDDYLYWTAAVRRLGKLIMPFDRVVAYIDPRELGEVAARVLLSDDAGHIGQAYNIDNGQDLIRFADATRMLGEVLEREIEYVDDPDVFLRESGPRYVEMYGEGGDRYFMEFYRFEQVNQLAFRRTDFAESVLGRKPKTLRAWFEEHRELLMNGAQQSAA